MKNSKSYIILIIVILIGMYIDETFFEPKRIENEKIKSEIKQKKIIEKWTKKTVDYFKAFNCSELKTEIKDLKIEKFLVVDSYSKNNCKINLNEDLEFDKYQSFENSFSRNIDDVNVIIWIVEKPGKEEGSYSNFTKAVRYSSELNFIEKSTKTIYKTISLDYIGKAPTEIRRKQGSAGGVEYFGKKPYESIYKTILNEIRKP